MEYSWHTCMKVLVVFVIGVTMTNCTKESSGLGTHSRATTSIDRLPSEFHGAWTFQGSSGGMDGQGNAAYRIEKIVIHDPNIIEEHRPGGNVTRNTFTAGRGKSIFSTEEVWQIQRKNSPLSEVLTLTTNGDLTVSENVYDGFSYSFKRAEAPLGSQ